MKQSQPKFEQYPLFQECLDALGNNVTILNKVESIKIGEFFNDWIDDSIGFSRIDWTKVDRKISISEPHHLLNDLEKLLDKPLDPTIYLISSNSYPTIKTDLHSIIAHFDDIICLGFEVWMFNVSQRYIIEYYYLNEMHAGIFPLKLKSTIDLLLQLENAISGQSLEHKFHLLEYKLHHLFEKIKTHENLEQAESEIALLLYIKDLLKKLKFYQQIDIGLNLWDFAKNFHRIDDKSVRKAIFCKIKENKFVFSSKLIERWQ